MRRPCAIDMHGHWVKVVWKDHIPADDIDDFVWAHYVIKDREIHIRKDVKPRFVVPLLFHELFHHMMSANGYTEILGESDEEMICRGIESWGDVFQLNPRSKRIKWREYPF